MNFYPNLMSNVYSNLSMTDSQWRPYTRSSNTLNSQFQALNSFLLYTVDARVWGDMLQGHVTETHSSATLQLLC